MEKNSDLIKKLVEANKKFEEVLADPNATQDEIDVISQQVLDAEDACIAIGMNLVHV